MDGRRGSVSSPTVEADRPSQEGLLPKPRKRRESLKDQILKLTGKAQFRVMDAEGLGGRSESIGTPPILSPVSPSTPSPFPPIDERIESPTPSQTSSTKKTSISSDLRTTLRGKIREQAQSLVDRTRGAAALSKRLERKVTVTASATTAEDINNDDATIEGALQKAEAITRQPESANELSESTQIAFLTNVVEREGGGPAEEAKILTSFHGAVAAPPLDRGLLRFPPREEQPGEAEEGPSPWDTRPPVDWRRLLHRMQRTKVEGRWRTTDHRLKGVGWESDALVAFVPPILSSSSVRVLDEVEVDVGRLVFSHHWAFSAEDAAASALREAFEDQATAALVVMEAVGEGAEAGELAAALAAHRHFLHLGKRVEDAAEALAAVRTRQTFTANSVVFEKGTDDRSPLSLSSLGRLSSRPLSSLLPPSTTRRLAAAAKIRLYIVVHYNGIVALRSLPKKLQEFTVNFKQIYTLRVHSLPTSLTVSICEKSSRRDRVLAVVGLALPSPRSKIQFACDESFPVVEDSLGASGSTSRVHGFLECGVQWKGGGDEGITVSSSEPSTGPFSLFIPECELDDSHLEEERMGRVEESLGREEPLSPLAFRLRLERERMAARATALAMRRAVVDRMEHRGVGVEDIVREDPIPSFAIALGSLFGPADVSRKLKPMRKDPTRTQGPTTASFRLVVNVQSSRNLPPRADGSPLRPFVSLTTSKGTHRTPTANGTNANWQHTLLVEMEGDRTEMGPVRVEVFDEVVRALPHDDRLVHTRYEESIPVLLGHATISASAICARSKIDSFVYLDTPLFASDYKLDPSHSAYLKVLIALEPATVLPSTGQLPSGTGEGGETMALCSAWTSACSSLHPSRSFSCLSLSGEGRGVVASRFLRPLLPPPSIDSLRSDPRQFFNAATRAVSFLPFLPDHPVLVKLPNMWSSTDTLLSLEYGSVGEHGVLLCCWCLSLGVPVHLLLGRGAVEGEAAALVLLSLPSGSLLANPLNGRVFPVEEDSSPLWVHSAVSPSNVYGNIQPLAHSSQIHFDFTKKDSWRPLFPKDQALPSVQPDSAVYTPMKEDSVVELKAALERELKLRVDDARQFGIPQWNLLAARYLRECLSSSPSPSASALEEALGRLRPSFVVSLYVVTVPFVSVAECVDAVLAARIHTSAHPQAQFALGVATENPFNSVIAVTLALALLTPKE